MADPARRVLTRRLIVLQHGSHGAAADWAVLTRLLLQPAGAASGSKEAAAGSSATTDGAAPVMEVFAPAVVEGRATDAGTAACGRALTQPLVHRLEQFRRAVEADGPHAVGGVSFVGHSFGGVMLRSAAMRLQGLGYMPSRFAVRAERRSAPPFVFERFVTVASPHAGIAHTSRTMRYVARAAAKAISSTTYRELLLETDTLDRLAADQGQLQALEAFRERIAIATTGDHLVPAPSALLAPVGASMIRGFSVRCGLSYPASSAAALIEIDPHSAIAGATGFDRPTAAVHDLYSSEFVNVRPWADSSPCLTPRNRERAAFIAAQLRSAGPWRTFVAPFPMHAAATTHRAVIGKPPFDTEHKASPSHLLALARLIAAPTK